MSLSSIRVSGFVRLLPALAAAATIGPKYTCGGPQQYRCDPNDVFGGACCSQYGYCGSTDQYCGQGCQSAYGYCSEGKPPSSATVPGLGYFTNYKVFNFDGPTLPDGLIASDYSVNYNDSTPTAKYNHLFTPSNVAVRDGFLMLTVPGGQHPSFKKPAACAEVLTTVSNILYASVRTRAILTKEPGVVDGMFFHHDDCQEIDIEYLPDAASGSNPGRREPIPIQYTNQATNCDHDFDTYKQVETPAIPTSAEHEYRVDWTPGKVDFYTDGKHTQTFTNNVPTKPGNWIWNIWTNGDPNFSVGPPKGDAVFKISQITMYYNTTSD